MDGDVVILGAGHAGGVTALALRDLGFRGAITLVGDEAETPYERPSLSKAFLAGKDADPVRLATPERWEALDVSLRLGVSAEAIDRTGRTVHLNDGARLSYDKLVLAVGGAPRALPFAAHLRLFALRTAGDARAIAAAATPGARAVLIGGGVIGLETASTLRELGLSVTVVEAGVRLLGRNVPAEAADWLAAAHARVGVEIRLGRAVTAIDAQAESLTVLLDDGAAIPADLVVVGIGIIPRMGLASQAGLSTDGGVLVDADYRSIDDSNIFAVGDLAVRRFGQGPTASRMETWAHAQASGRAAALAILGQPPEAEPVPWFWTDQCGHSLQILGDPSQADSAVARGEGVRLYLREGLLVGAACLDQPREFAAARRLIGRRLIAEAAADPATDLRRAAA
jgi:3-phenylpropionate/trans-cinnamate dioxygenase ferredoxin reductase subunit